MAKDIDLLLGLEVFGLSSVQDERNGKLKRQANLRQHFIGNVVTAIWCALARAKPATWVPMPALNGIRNVRA